MPKYFFNIYPSRAAPKVDLQGQQFTDDRSACREAIKVAAELVTDLEDGFEVGDEWRLEVTSEMQKEPLYIVRFSVKRTF
jgi:hypothetical protein